MKVNSKDSTIVFSNSSELDTYIANFIDKKENYNGWSNYATWRVNLEMIDGSYYHDSEQTYNSIVDLSDSIKDYCNEQMYQYDIDTPCLVIDYAIAFLSDVNWYEIAEKISEDYPSILAVRCPVCDNHFINGTCNDCDELTASL